MDLLKYEYKVKELLLTLKIDGFNQVCDVNY